MLLRVAVTDLHFDESLELVGYDLAAHYEVLEFAEFLCDFDFGLLERVECEKVEGQIEDNCANIIALVEFKIALPGVLELHKLVHLVLVATQNLLLLDSLETPRSCH